MAEPWLQAGYSAILIDPQHAHPFKSEQRPEGGYVWKVGDVINSRRAMYYLRIALDHGIAFVAGFPPCTDVAISGTRHWAKKRDADIHFQAKAALIAEQCRMIGQLSGAPWFFENPVSAFSKIFGKPNYTFDPCDYGGYLSEDDVNPIYPKHIPARDAYKKKTCLWTGNGFVMPPTAPVDGLPFQEALNIGGKSQRTKNIRSVTPRGFARAVYFHNAGATEHDDITPA